jgi:LysM repeat protein
MHPLKLLLDAPLADGIMPAEVLMQSRSRGAAIVAVILLAIGIVITFLALRARPTPPTPTPSLDTPIADMSTVTPIAVMSPSPSPTPSLLLYTIQDGDTLASIATAFGVTLEELIQVNGISDPNLIHPGQALAIPGLLAPISESSPTPQIVIPTLPPAPPPPTPTPSGPYILEIANVLGTGILESEVVRIRNRGGAADLEGWTLSGPGRAEFTFPRLVLFQNGEIGVYTGPGESTPTELHWGRSRPAWESGVLIVLRDPWEAVVDTYLVP